MSKFGIPAAPEDVINSSLVMAEALAAEAPGARIYVVGEAPLVRELQQAGLVLSGDPAQTDFVILSFDRTFHYGKLRFAHEAVMRGARIWATNTDRACPVEGGQIPDAASVIGAVEGATGAKVECVVGKPSAIIMQVASARLGVPLQACVMVGDRLETDIVMGQNAGMATALALTGVTTREMLAASPIQPDYVLESVQGLAEVR